MARIRLSLFLYYQISPRPAVGLVAKQELPAPRVALSLAARTRRKLDSAHSRENGAFES